tara:strand:- start:10 stop:909 length:900 start_codon:yes stop_codon:yes gene_type:complete
MAVFAGQHKDYDKNKSYRNQKPVYRSPNRSGGGDNNKKTNEEIAEQFNITQPGEFYKDTGGTTKDFQKDLAKAAQFGLFTQHPFTKELMRKYNLDTEDIINLRLGTGSGGVGRADPSKLYNKSFNPGLGAGPGNMPGVFQKLFGSGLFPMSLGPGNLGQRGIDAFREGMTVYDRPEPMGLRDQLGALLGSRFDKIAGGSPTGIAALDYGRNVLGFEGDQLNKFASAVAGDRNLFNEMSVQPFSVDKQLQELRYDYQRNNQPMGGSNQQVKPEPDPITAAYNPAMNPFFNQGIQPLSYMV